MQAAGGLGGHTLPARQAEFLSDFGARRRYGLGMRSFSLNNTQKICPRLP